MTSRPHKKLLVWQKSLHFVKDIYVLSNSFPQQEKYGMTSQLKRASVSILLNIAEGAARSSKKEFVQFLSISRGSVSEVDALLDILKELNYIESESYNSLAHKLNEISALLQGLIRKIKVDNNL